MGATPDRFNPLPFYLLAAFAAAVALVIIIFGMKGAGNTGTRLALTVTARFSFLLFWLSYSASAMAALFGPVFLPLKRHAREFGLAFASAQLVHLGLVGWLCHLGQTPALATFLFFGTAVFWLYLIVFFSVSQWREKLNPTFRRLVFFVGLNYIAYAFAADFFASPLQGGFKRVVFYLPFAAMSVAGPALCLSAFLLRFRRKSAGAVPLA